MIQRVLIANRGEIACRVARTCRRLGIGTVAVFSDADADALHVESCDAAVRLPGTAPADTYLRADLLIDAAQRAEADAVHPGYGFLAESPAFAEAVAAAGLTWIGPPPAAMAAMGSKVRAKELMRAAGVPVLPDSTVEGVDDLDAVGYPMLVKASAGGGGRGMRIVRSPADVDQALVDAEREAASAFGDGHVFCERYVERGRHVEIQVFADTHGHVVSLHERECSIQRRHQKIVEEAPSPAVDGELRSRMGAAAVDAARAVGYVGAGTVEFLLDPEGRFWFLEMNTRLQVEHPVTEAVTGLDLVALQLAVAEGAPLPPEALEPRLEGHAIEVRLTAEDPAAGYRPSTGTFAEFAVDTDAVRVDTGVRSGSSVPPFYDSLIAKIVASGPDRPTAVRALRRALAGARLHGPVTNRDQLLNVLEHPDFVAGELHTGFLDEHDLTTPRHGDRHLALAAVALAEQAANRAGATVQRGIPSGWRNNPALDQTIRLRLGEATTTVAYRIGPGGHVTIGDQPYALDVVDTRPDAVVVDVHGVRHRIAVGRTGDDRHVDLPDGHVTVRVESRFPDPHAAAAPGSLVAPMPGAVLRILATPGGEVAEGEPLVVMEAMKMEHQVAAPAAGTVSEVLVAVGDQVETGQVLLVLEGASDD